MRLFLYTLLLFSLTLFSYGFVDANSPFPRPLFLYRLVHFNRAWTTIIYSAIVIFFFIFYFHFLSQVKKKKLDFKKIRRLIILSAFILFFAFPGFSYDVFNYLATARVAFLYEENPYLIMPIEIPNEPMLSFMHAANKTALYGPVWILLTALPHFAGWGNLFFTVFTFKALVFLFYFGILMLIWRLSDKNLLSLAFFALNPLVILETLASGHNDVVMMFLALFAFYLLKKKRFSLACASLFLSSMIKFATLFLVPSFLYASYLLWCRQKIKWSKVWQLSFYGMMLIFLLSPLREEIYSWYFIWPLSFLALLPNFQLLTGVGAAFSFGLLFRLAPFLYTRSWTGSTPVIKKIVSFIPPSLTLLLLKLKDKG